MRNPLLASVAEAADDLGDGQVHDIRWLAGRMKPAMWLRAAAIALAIVLSAGIVVGAVVFALAVSW